MRRHDLTNKTGNDKDNDKDKDNGKDILENTLKERPQRLLTFETFDQSDEET